MKSLKKCMAMLVLTVSIIASNLCNVMAYTYNLSDSDTNTIRNNVDKYYTCTLYMDSTVTGGAKGLGYSVKSTGTLKGSYPGFNPAFCEKIKYENTYKFSVIGGISLSVGSSGADVSGSSSSASRTISETYTKTDFPSLYKLNENISCKAECFIIYWHYQNASVTYTLNVNGNPVSTSISTADNTVIW